MRLSPHEIAAAAVKLLPGEYFAAAAPCAVTTLLGSCVSVCLYDRDSGVGGMNHFMLPAPPRAGEGHRCAQDCAGACSARYGSCAMRLLLERLEQLGARLSGLEAKVFGAGRVMAGAADIGGRNAAFALRYLQERNIPVVARDLGERAPRRVVFLTGTGQAFVKRVGSSQGEDAWRTGS